MFKVENFDLPALVSLLTIDQPDIAGCPRRLTADRLQGWLQTPMATIRLFVSPGFEFYNIKTAIGGEELVRAATTPASETLARLIEIEPLLLTNVGDGSLVVTCSERQLPLAKELFK